MGDDSGYNDDGPYDEKLKTAGIPLAPLPFPTQGLGQMAGAYRPEYQTGAMEQFKPPSLLEQLLKQREELTFRLQNINTLVNMLETNPEHKKFLETLQKINR